MTKKKMTLLRKHNVTEAPIRSLKQILAAEEEFFDRVWYDRSLLGEMVDKRNRVKPPKDIIKGMMAARKRVLAKYGKKNLGPYSDFDWGIRGLVLKVT
jgi:hypothetical protein